MATPNPKPYEIRERLFAFACDVSRVAQKLHTRAGIGAALSAQLASAAVSAAANAEEADDGSSRRDFIAKECIVLREVKETRLRLRVMEALGEVSDSDKSLLDESTLLVRIISTIIRNAGG
jgi:four helix bundle protein